MRYWIIHSNPKIWNSKKELKYESSGMYKINLSHKELINLGDKGILWISGPDAGVYSLIEMASRPYEQHFHYTHINKYALDKKKFIGQQLVVDISFVKKLTETPITKKGILKNNMLNVLHFFTNPQGQNTFELSEMQYLFFAN